MAGAFTRKAHMFASAAVVTDPNFASTVLLLGFEGADASTIFTDESSKLRGSGNVFSNAQVDTADKKFGSASGLFDGAGDLIAWPDSADWAFGTVPFTVECWVKPATVAAGTYFLVGQWNNTGNLAWILYQNGAALAFNVSTTGSDNITQLSGGTLSTSGFQHVCADYDGTKYRAYIGGVMVASSTTARNIFNSAEVLGVGASGGAGFGYNGWMDELRITKGVARYASDGGFAVPTAAFPRS